MRAVLLIALFAAILFIASDSTARSDTVDYPWRSAVETRLGKERLLNMPYYFIGQKHPAVKTDFGVYTSNRKTNAFNKTDQEACNVAFLSALISLQERANKLGADAVIDIRSITKHKNMESADKYRCVVGRIISHVGLSGKMVKFKSKPSQKSVMLINR